MNNSRTLIALGWLTVVALSILPGFAVWDVGIYLFCIGLFQLLLIFVVFAVLAIAAAVRRTIPLVRWMSCYLAFNIWFLAFGIIGSVLWNHFARDCLYVNRDAFIEWLPFILPGNWTLDLPCGRILTPGTTWLHLYLLWAATAIPVWVLTFVAYRKTKPFILNTASPRKTLAILFSIIIGAIALPILGLRIFAMFAK